MNDNELLLAISNMLDPIKEDIQDIRDDIQNLRDDVQDIKNRVKRIELTQENIVLPRLDTIESCYISTYDRYKKNTETYESMKQDIAVIKSVVTEHSKKLQNIS